MKAQTNSHIALTASSERCTGRTVKWFEVECKPGSLPIVDLEWDSPKPNGFVPNGYATLYLHDRKGERVLDITGHKPLIITLPACITLQGRWPRAGRLLIGGVAEVAVRDGYYIAASEDHLEYFDALSTGSKEKAPCASE